jgi:hypothetical protein
VGQTGESLLVEITKFTNSQNAVREKDFLALINDFRVWQRQMSDKYGVYLEIQRGGWDSQKAYQRQHPGTKQYKVVANSFDLLKVYGAGWFGEAGVAFGKNAPFLPNGSIYRRIIGNDDDNNRFDVDDLYTAYRLQKIADKYGFGRGTDKITRRQTRFLFYMIAIDILKDILIRQVLPFKPKDITFALLKLFQQENTEACNALFDVAVDVVDSYLTRDIEESVFIEPAFQTRFNNDLNAFLKWDQLGKHDQDAPILRSALTIVKYTLNRTIAGQPSIRSMVVDVIKQSTI